VTSGRRQRTQRLSSTGPASISDSLSGIAIGSCTTGSKTRMIWPSTEIACGTATSPSSRLRMLCAITVLPLPGGP
jgi:hypothetical protein